MRLQKCSDPFHDTRRNNPGWQDILAIRLDAAGDINSPPILADGRICLACNAAYEMNLAQEVEVTRGKKRAAFQKLRALGFNKEEIELMGLNFGDETSNFLKPT